MKDNQLIDQYINGSLDESARKAFEERLETDPDFAKQYKEIISLKAGVRLSHLEDKLDFLKKVEADKSAKDTKVVDINASANRPMLKWLAAAAIALLFGILLWQSGQSDPLSSQELFAENFIPDENIFDGTTRGDANRSECYNNYSLKRWDETIACILELISSEETDIDFYYLGISYLSKDMPKEAITSFDKIVAAPDGISQNRIFWYKGLANIYVEDLDKAVENLSQIKGGLLENKAQEILDAIEKLQSS